MNSKAKEKKNFLGWLAEQWKNNSLFSIGLVLLFMIILQTFALNFSACESFGAVSYTHLDVYKRQSGRCAQQRADQAYTGNSGMGEI